MGKTMMNSTRSWLALPLLAVIGYSNTVMAIGRPEFVNRHDEQLVQRVGTCRGYLHNPHYQQAEMFYSKQIIPGLRAAREAALNRQARTLQTALATTRHAVEQVQSLLRRDQDDHDPDILATPSDCGLTAKLLQDINAARTPAALATPDWSASLEAIQSALDSLNLRRVPLLGLHMAYHHALTAYILALSSGFRPDQQQQVRNYLVKTMDSLAGTEDGRTLIPETRALLSETRPDAARIKTLLNDIQIHIDLALDERWSTGNSDVN